MTFQLRGSLAFSFSKPTIDPVSYAPEDEDVVSGDWRRITRTMKGERTGAFMPYLLEWDKADAKARNLAELVDELADERRWMDVQMLPGLYKVLKHSERDPVKVPADVGVLVCVLPVDGWNPERPSNRMAIDWLDDPSLLDNPNRLGEKVAEATAVMKHSPEIHHIECYSLDTRAGRRKAIDTDRHQKAAAPAAA